MSETKPGALTRFWSSKASAVAAVVVIALVVLSIGALIVWNTIDNTKDAPAGAEGGITATAPATAAATASDTPGGCDVPAGDQSLRPAVPMDLEWKAANGVTWPVSTTAGPTQTNADGFGICFAKSPLGAALMTATYFGTGFGVNELAAAELYLADSPGKAVSVAEATAGPVSGQIFSSTAGFTVKDFDASAGTASVAVVFELATSTTGFASAEIPMRWIEGDWKIYWPEGGTKSLVYDTPVAGQFTTWKGTQ